MTNVPRSHPRYLSLKLRDKITNGVIRGITSIHGLISHGRGEAFDYLIGEKTNKFALESVKAAAAMLLLAKKVVISVNGNAAALAQKDIVKLSILLNCPIEINIFHASKKRELKIREYLINYGAKNILMPGNSTIKYLESNRKFVNKDGIFRADVVFVPLEDGDRCEALRKMGKKVITVDLNPLSRTSRKADITIVDNIIRCLPLINKEVVSLKKTTETNKKIKNILRGYDNQKILNMAEKRIRSGG